MEVRLLAAAKAKLAFGAHLGPCPFLFLAFGTLRPYAFFFVAFGALGCYLFIFLAFAALGSCRDGVGMV